MFFCRVLPFGANGSGKATLEIHFFADFSLFFGNCFIYTVHFQRDSYIIFNTEWFCVCCFHSSAKCCYAMWSVVLYSISIGICSISKTIFFFTFSTAVLWTLIHSMSRNESWNDKRDLALCDLDYGFGFFFSFLPVVAIAAQTREA